MSNEQLKQEMESIKTMLSEMSLNTKEYLDVEETAKFLHLSVSSVYKLTHRSILRYSKSGGKKILFRRSDLVEYIEKGFSSTSEEYQKLTDKMIDRTFKKRR